MTRKQALFMLQESSGFHGVSHDNLERIVHVLEEAGAFDVMTKEQAHEFAQIVATNAGGRCGACLGVNEAWEKVAGPK